MEKSEYTLDSNFHCLLPKAPLLRVMDFYLCPKLKLASPVEVICLHLNQIRWVVLRLSGECLSCFLYFPLAVPPVLTTHLQWGDSSYHDESLPSSLSAHAL